MNRSAYLNQLVAQGHLSHEQAWAIHARENAERLERQREYERNKKRRQRASKVAAAVFSEIVVELSPGTDRDMAGLGGTGAPLNRIEIEEREEVREAPAAAHAEPLRSYADLKAMAEAEAEFAMAQGYSREGALAEAHLFAKWFTTPRKNGAVPRPHDHHVEWRKWIHNPKNKKRAAAAYPNQTELPLAAPAAAAENRPPAEIANVVPNHPQAEPGPEHIGIAAKWGYVGASVHPVWKKFLDCYMGKAMSPAWRLTKWDQWCERENKNARGPATAAQAGRHPMSIARDNLIAKLRGNEPTSDFAGPVLDLDAVDFGAGPHPAVAAQLLRAGGSYMAAAG